jgi:uncharacterized protein YkwD
MKSKLKAKLLIAALCGAVFSCSSPQATVSAVPATPSSRSGSSLSDQVFAEVNSYRVSKGKRPLDRHAGLDRLAQQHCNYLAKNGAKFSLHGKYVSHIGFEGRSLAAKQAYKITTIGENVVASSNHSPKHLVELWAGSRTHEQNMRSDWSCTGVATAVNTEGMLVSTQIFGSAPNSSFGTRAGVTPNFGQYW